MGDYLTNAKTRNLSQITNIRKRPPQPTYNFEVSPNENYIANDILVHNMAFQKMQYVPNTGKPSGEWVAMYDSTGAYKEQVYRVPFTMKFYRDETNNQTQVLYEDYSIDQTGTDPNSSTEWARTS